MRTKAERRDNDSSSMDADKVARQNAPAGSAAFGDMRPQALVQRQNIDMANASVRLDEQRMLASAIQRKTDGAAALNRTGLPDQLKAGIEALSGISLDDVKVHYNSPQPAQLNAHAYAQASNIHIAPGQEKHLAHEAWHVVQQAQGRVRPTMQMRGAVHVNDDDGLEREADLMGAKALGAGAKSESPLSHEAPHNMYTVFQKSAGMQLPVQRMIAIQGNEPMAWPMAYLAHVYPRRIEIMTETRASEQDITTLLKGYDRDNVEFASMSKMIEVMKQDLTIGSLERFPDVRQERVRLVSVSLASEIHHLNKLGEKFLGVMTQPWGFSFADVGDQRTDLAWINEYIAGWNENRVQAEIHVKDGEKFQYTAPSGRVYSTHSDSSQLYPIGGPGVYCGNGAGDMYRILKHLKKDSPAKVIQLAQALSHSQTEEFIAASEEKKAGGHRSGVEIPKAKVTSAGNIEKMKEFRLKPILEDAIAKLEAVELSTQFSLGGH